MSDATMVCWLSAQRPRSISRPRPRRHCVTWSRSERPVARLILQARTANPTEMPPEKGRGPRSALHRPGPWNGLDRASSRYRRRNHLYLDPSFDHRGPSFHGLAPSFRHRAPSIHCLAPSCLARNRADPCHPSVAGAVPVSGSDPSPAGNPAAAWTASVADVARASFADPYQDRRLGPFRNPAPSCPAHYRKNHSPAPAHRRLQVYALLAPLRPPSHPAAPARRRETLLC
jgi:hypothetical protein